MYNSIKTVCVTEYDNNSRWDTAVPGPGLHFWYAGKNQKPTAAAAAEATTSDGAEVFSSAQLQQSSAYPVRHRHRPCAYYYSRSAWSAPTPAARPSRRGR